MGLDASVVDGGGLPCPSCGVPYVAMMTRRGPAWTCRCTHPECRPHGRERAWLRPYGPSACDEERETPASRAARRVLDKMERLLEGAAAEAVAAKARRKGKKGPRGRSGTS